MPDAEQFVDVRHRGLPAGERLKLHEFSPSTAYLEMPQPLPVGAELTLATDAGFEVPVRVVRVQEQVAGAAMPPGMRVSVGALEGDAKAWWDALISTEDPVIPEPAAGGDDGAAAAGGKQSQGNKKRRRMKTKVGVVAADEDNATAEAADEAKAEAADGDNAKAAAADEENAKAEAADEDNAKAEAADEAKAEAPARRKRRRRRRKTRAETE